MEYLIKEFFYDGISRIIPGLVVIALYGRNIGMTGDFHDASLMLNLYVIVAAWVIGAIIEMLTYFPALLVKSPRKTPHDDKPPSRWARVIDWFLPTFEHDATLSATRIEQIDRLMTKKYGEAVMFRCLIAIFTFSYFSFYFWPPKVFWSIEWSKTYSTIGAVTSVFGWFYLKYTFPRKSKAKKTK